MTAAGGAVGTPLQNFDNLLCLRYDPSVLVFDVVASGSRVLRPHPAGDKGVAGAADALRQRHRAVGAPAPIAVRKSAESQRHVPHQDK